MTFYFSRDLLFIREPFTLYRPFIFLGKSKSNHMKSLIFPYGDLLLLAYWEK